MDIKKIEHFIRVTSETSHDLNNTLAALRGFAEFLEEDLPEDTPEKTFASKILLSALQAQREIEVLQNELRNLKE